MTIKDRIIARENLCGCHVHLGDVAATEILAGLGYDMVWIDMEHTSLSCEQVHHHMLAAEAAGTPAIIRVPANDMTTTKRILEMGPDAIVFPMVRDSEHARELLSWTLYPPFGKRGFGPKRAVRYGLDEESRYCGEGHLSMCRFVQVEQKSAVEDVERLAELPYLDGCILGLCDLSGSINRLGDTYCEENLALAQKTIDAFRSRNKTVGVSTGAVDYETLRRFRDMGINLIFSGADFEYIREGGRRTLHILQDLQSIR